MKTLSVVKINRLLEYNEKTGELTWKVDVGSKVKTGDKAGISRKDRPPAITIGGREYPLTNVVWCLVYGKYPDRTIYFKSKKALPLLVPSNLTFEKPKKKSNPIVNHIKLSPMTEVRTLSRENLLVEVAVLSREKLMEKARVLSNNPINGKRLTTWKDVPQDVKCYCPKCQRMYNKKMINYTGNTPACIPCKRCNRKQKTNCFFVKQENRIS